MTTWFAFFFSSVGPLAIRVLVAVGFVAVSFSGVTAAFAALVSYSQAQWASLPVAVLQLASISGVPVGLGLVFGASVARVTLWAAGNATKLVFKGV